MELLLGDRQGRQVIMPVMVPLPPDERSVHRCHSGVNPNTAIAAMELHDGEIRVCRNDGREAERQDADRESKSLHAILDCWAFCGLAQLLEAAWPVLEERELFDARSLQIRFPDLVTTS